jgi:hypothetical protein
MYAAYIENPRYLKIYFWIELVLLTISSVGLLVLVSIPDFLEKSVFDCYKTSSTLDSFGGESISNIFKSDCLDIVNRFRILVYVQVAITALLGGLVLAHVHKYYRFLEEELLQRMSKPAFV